jgi:hypothetical protein
MRLLCINNKPIPGADNSPEFLNAIKEGRDYDGYKAKGRSKDGEICDVWCIPSISDKEGYALQRFIQLPDTTADEMDEETREAIVNLETVLA